MSVIFHRLTDAHLCASHDSVLSVRTQAFVRFSRAVSLRFASRGLKSFLHYGKPSPNIALQRDAPLAAHP